MAVMNVSSSRNFAHQHDVWVFADRVLHADLEILHVEADLALVNQGLSSVKMNSIGSSSVRICTRSRWLMKSSIDAIVVLCPSRSRRRGAPSLVVKSKAARWMRQEQTLEVRDLVADAAGDEAHAAVLLQKIDAEAALGAINVAHMRKVRPAFVRRKSAGSGRSSSARDIRPSRAAPQADDSAVSVIADAHARRLAHLQVQVAPFQLDERAKRTY